MMQGHLHGGTWGCMGVLLLRRKKGIYYPFQPLFAHSEHIAMGTFHAFCGSLWAQPQPWCAGRCCPGIAPSAGAASSGWWVRAGAGALLRPEAGARMAPSRQRGSDPPLACREATMPWAQLAWCWCAGQVHSTDSILPSLPSLTVTFCSLHHRLWAYFDRQF